MSLPNFIYSKYFFSWLQYVHEFVYNSELFNFYFKIIIDLQKSHKDIEFPYTFP